VSHNFVAFYNDDDEYNDENDNDDDDDDDDDDDNNNNNNNKGQSNLALGSTAANWRFDPQNLLIRRGGDRGNCLIQCYLGPDECPCQMVSLPSNSFSRVHECDRRHTYRHTDGQTTLR